MLTIHFNITQKITRRNTEQTFAKTRSQFRNEQFQVGWNCKARFQLFQIHSERIKTMIQALQTCWIKEGIKCWNSIWDPNIFVIEQQKHDCGDEPISIKRIFRECPQYNRERNICFYDHRSLETILGWNGQNLLISAIFKFLTITDLLSLIWGNIL